jgi:Na+/H+-dicarboxylate symporter
MKLILKLIIGIIAGIVIGFVAPEILIRLAVTVKIIFASFLEFIVPFLILFFIASGVAKLEQQIGRIVGIAVGLAYIFTLIAGGFAYTIGHAVIPLFSLSTSALQTGIQYAPLVAIKIDPMMSVMTALVAAFVFGIGSAAINSKAFEQGIHEGKAIIELVIKKIIIPFLPFYIACLFASFAAEGTAFDVLKIFGKILLLVILSHWIWLSMLYLIAGIVSKKNPVRLLKNMLPAYFTAIGTMSSAATIPVTLESVKKNGISDSMANFAVPLYATIHISGSMITITTCIIAVMAMTPGMGIPSFEQLLPIIFTLALIMIAAPGVPGGGIMAAIGVLTSMLGFGEIAIGLMIALYVAQDSFGTATNVTGDGALIALLDKFKPEKTSA